MTNYIMGCDVSVWQDANSTPQQIDFKKMKANGAEFVFIRAGQHIWKDPDFDYNWKASKAAGLLRGAYWFLDYTRGTPPLKQAEIFAGMLLADSGELPPVIDFERVAIAPPTRDRWLQMCQSFMGAVDKALDVETMIYTNPDIIQNWIAPIPSWMLSRDLWIANYGPTAPHFKPWDTWTFWQWTDRGPGYDFGVESKQIDMDWFNGTLDDLYAFAGKEPVEKPVTDAEKLDRLWEYHPELHDER